MTFSTTNKLSRKKFVQKIIRAPFFSFPFDECSCFVCLRTRNKQKNSVCLSVRQSACLYVRPSSKFVRKHKYFWRSLHIQTKFGGCLLCIKCSSGIEIQSEIMILTLILNKNLNFDKNFVVHYQMWWVPSIFKA